MPDRHPEGLRAVRLPLAELDEGAAQIGQQGSAAPCRGAKAPAQAKCSVFAMMRSVMTRRPGSVRCGKRPDGVRHPSGFYASTDEAAN
jgi:hypothetical protein